MADRTPVRVVFNDAGVATGLAEFQSGDTIPVSAGGTGLTSIGSAGQIIKVNAAGTGLEFGAEGDISITNLVAPSNADLTFRTSGTGNIVLDAITVRGTTFSAADSTKITLAESVDITGTLTASGISFPTSDGSANQVLATNGSGTLSFISAAQTGDLSFIGSTINGSSNADITIQPAGTGNIVLDAVTINGTTLSAADSTKITIAEAVDITGALSANTSLVIAGDGATVTGIKDEDNMSSNSATKLATQQSIKAYVDTEIGNISTTSIVQNNSNITVADSGSGTITVTVDGSTIGTFTASGLQLGTSGARVTTILDEDNLGTNSDTALATQQSIKAYVDSQITAQDLDFSADDSTVLSIDLDSETLHFAGGTGISTSVSNNTVTHAIDATVATLTGSQTLTNKTLTTPTINGATMTGNVTVDNLTLNDNIISSSSNADLIIDPSGTGNIKLNATTDITGVATITNTTTDDSLLITSTEDSNSAAPVITLKRNSSSPADADYLGRINFKGENDADQAVTYARISGKILDASDGTEDGAIEFNTIKAGSSTISARLNSNELKLLNGTTLDVDGAGTFAGSVTATSVTTNDIVSNGSNATINITPAGTGGVIITSGGVAFTLPTTDGNDGDFLKTNGSGTLSFASSTATPSDDTRVVIKNNKTVSTSPRTVDYFQASSADMAWYFIALNDLTNDRSSASCFTVCHNDTDAFASGPRGGASGSANTLPSTSADVSSNQVRVKITAPSDDSKISYYKIPISRANTSDATAGATVTTSNTDVDSASEVIDSFAHASFRAAKYTILIDNNSKTETGVIEALVVHDGSEAFITQYGIVNSGNNDMVTLTAQIVLSNVVVSASGLEPNLSLKIHKTLLSDSMTAVSNANQKIIGATTISSSATAFDNFDLDDVTAAMYYVVGGNASEGEFSLYEVYCAGAPGEASVSAGPFVSTKATTQLQFTAGFKSDADNSLELSISSTSGGSTVVNAYRINCLAE